MAFPSTTVSESTLCATVALDSARTGARERCATPAAAAPVSHSRDVSSRYTPPPLVPTSVRMVDGSPMLSALSSGSAAVTRLPPTDDDPDDPDDPADDDAKKLAAASPSSRPPRSYARTLCGVTTMTPLAGVWVGVGCN